jgi:hypothetical protein
MSAREAIKVHKLGNPIFRDNNVIWLDVLVHVALGMYYFESLSHAKENIADVLGIKLLRLVFELVYEREY